MFSLLLRALAPFLLFSASAAAAQADPPVTAADLRRHVDVLASDAFEGREPGTPGERLTIDYIAAQFAARGLEPAVPDGSWFQPVALVERAPGSHVVRWSRGRRLLEFDQNEIVLIGREASVRIADAPVVFAGHGARMLDRGIDQLAGANLQGAVVLILRDSPDIPSFPSVAERAKAVSDAGAAAVIIVSGGGRPWDSTRRASERPVTRLQSRVVPLASGGMSWEAARRLFAFGRVDLDRLLNEQPGSSFRAVTLPMRATLEVTTGVRSFISYNVVGRIRGSATPPAGVANESLLFLGHWDHLGICRAEGEPDRICNGAVDNASGIAALIEIAGRLARAPRPQRDILFLATTAEEIGLLGAEYFAQQPTVPLARIVAALNLDTIAIHPAGTPVAVIGRGRPELDAVVDATIASLGRTLDTDTEADPFVTRQDGWALARHGVPALMAGGSFSNMVTLNAFLEGAYHGPGDQPGPNVPLDGAAEDATLHVALGRRLADPAIYRPAPRSP